MSWDRPFDQPVPLPSGPPARTLGDVINYIKTLPKSDRGALEWRVPIQTLSDAAEGRAPMLFAKLETLRAATRSSAASRFSEHTGYSAASCTDARPCVSFALGSGSMGSLPSI